MADVLKLVSNNAPQKVKEWKIPHWIRHNWGKWDLIGGGYQVRCCKVCGFFEKDYIGLNYKVKP